MEPSVLTSVIAAIGSVLAVGITGWFGFRGARAAQAQAGSLAAQNRELDQVKLWRDDVEALRRQRVEDEARHKQEREESARQIEGAHQRITELSRRVEMAERREEALLRWARRIVEQLQDTGIPFPPPPPGVIDGRDAQPTGGT